MPWKQFTYGVRAAIALLGAAGLIGLALFFGSIFRPQVFGGSATATVHVTELYDSTIQFNDVAPCTGTIVGPRTLLTAAHCVDWPTSSGVEAGLRFSVRAEVYKATCTRARDYRSEVPGRYRDDLAMCLTDRDVIGVPFEVADLSSSVAQNQTIVLVGFGCNEDGTQELRSGNAIVDAPVTAENQIVTRLTGANSCEGDSGGGVYTEHVDASSRTVRRLIGVMSSREYSANGKASATRIARLNGSSLTDSQYGATCGVHHAYTAGSDGCRW